MTQENEHRANHETAQHDNQRDDENILSRFEKTP